MTDERPLDEIIDSAPAPATPAPADQAQPQNEQSPIDNAPAEEPQSWTYAALKDERGKRQRAQERVADLEQQLAATQPQQSPSDEFWADPDTQLSRMQAVASRATLRASQAEIVAEHGREALNEINEAVRQAMEDNHPDLPVLREAMLQSDHPALVAAQWVASQQRRTSNQRPAPSQPYPTNLASARSVGARRGPAWTGPMALDDIFERGRPK